MRSVLDFTPKRLDLDKQVPYNFEMLHSFLLDREVISEAGERFMQWFLVTIPQRRFINNKERGYARGRGEAKLLSTQTLAKELE